MQPWILAYCCVLGFVEVHPQLLYLLDWGYVGFTPTWMLSLHAESQLLSCVFFVSLYTTHIAQYHSFPPVTLNQNFMLKSMTSHL